VSLSILREVAKLSGEYYSLWSKIYDMNVVRERIKAGNYGQNKRIKIPFKKLEKVRVYDNRYNKEFTMYVKSLMIEHDKIVLIGSTKGFFRTLSDDVEVVHFLAFNDNIADYVEEKVKVMNERVKRKRLIVNTILNELGGTLAIALI